MAVETLDLGDLSGVGPEPEVDGGEPCKASSGLVVLGGVTESIIFFMPYRSPGTSSCRTRQEQKRDSCHHSSS